MDEEAGADAYGITAARGGVEFDTGRWLACAPFVMLFDLIDTLSQLANFLRKCGMRRHPHFIVLGRRV